MADVTLASAGVGYLLLIYPNRWWSRFHMHVVQQKYKHTSSSSPIGHAEWISVYKGR